MINNEGCPGLKYLTMCPSLGKDLLVVLLVLLQNMSS